MSEDKLKPCPYCGGKTECYSNSLKGNSVRYTVICNQYCGAMVQAKQKQWAIKAWNTRANKTDKQNLDFIAQLKKQSGEIERLRAENAELKHILFESIIAPNCSTCSNQMGTHCDNGIICMDKLLKGEFVNFNDIKLKAKVKWLSEANRKMEEEGSADSIKLVNCKKSLAESVAREAELIADNKDEHCKNDLLRKEVEYQQTEISDMTMRRDNLQLEVTEIKERVGKRLEVCAQQNGRPECKNCGLNLLDIKGEK